MRTKRPLENHRKLHAFAKKWLLNVKNGLAGADSDFAEDCFKHGFDMDCGVVFKVTFQDEKYFYDSDAFAAVAPKILDVKLLCSAIFSRLREIQFSHIKEHIPPKKQCLSESEIKWFSAALSRLAEITGK